MHTQMQPADTDRVAWSVCLSVCHTSELCKNGSTDRDAVWVEDTGWPTKPCIRWGSGPPWEGAFVRGEREAHCKVSYRDALSWAVQNGGNDQDAVWVVDICQDLLIIWSNFTCIGMWCLKYRAGKLRMSRDHVTSRQVETMTSYDVPRLVLPVSHVRGLPTVNNLPIVLKYRMMFITRYMKPHGFIYIKCFRNDAK